MDRYDVPFIKDQARKVRAKKINSQGRQKAVHKVIGNDVAFPQGGDGFKSFLSVDQNKMQLQQMIGDALISHAPRNECIVVSGAVESPTQVKCSSLDVNTDDLQSDHHEANTRLVVSIIHSLTQTIQMCSLCFCQIMTNFIIKMCL